MLGAGEIVGEASWAWLGAGIESPLLMIHNYHLEAAAVCCFWDVNIASLAGFSRRRGAGNGLADCIALLLSTIGVDANN